FRRMIRKPAFKAPSGRKRGMRKHERPACSCARTRNASHIGAEQNHLWPVSTKPSAAGSARVVLARTSDPPCFSVIAIPKSTPDFRAAGMKRESYVHEVIRGPHSAKSAPCSAGYAEYVI